MPSSRSGSHQDDEYWQHNNPWAPLSWQPPDELDYVAHERQSASTSSSHTKPLYSQVLKSKYIPQRSEAQEVPSSHKRRRDKSESPPTDSSHVRNFHLIDPKRILCVAHKSPSIPSTGSITRKGSSHIYGQEMLGPKSKTPCLPSATIQVLIDIPATILMLENLVRLLWNFRLLSHINMYLCMLEDSSHGVPKTAVVRVLIEPCTTTMTGRRSTLCTTIHGSLSPPVTNTISVWDITTPLRNIEMDLQ